LKYFTFIGNHDAIGPDTIGFGAALTIFMNYKDDIDGVYILTTPDNPRFAYKQMAEKTKRVMQAEKSELSVKIIEVELDSPVNFDLVYSVMLDETQKLMEDDSIIKDEKIINITSGTPTMSTCWVLLQKSGLIPNAKLIQSFELQFQRQYGKTCQEVNLEIDDFPEIEFPSGVKRELNRLNKEVNVLREEKSVNIIDKSIPSIVGNSKSIRQIKEQIKRLINTKTHVLILGERGTGKDVVATAIWDIHRKEIDKEFIVFDCGVFNSDLILSELFGHEKGAFTGANRMKKGIIEQSDGKMLFLDEIGNLSLNSQKSLLRLVQFGEWKKVGSSTTNESDIQVVAATNMDINDKNIFRQDLKDRFDEIIVLPTLRERKEDIKILVDHFLLTQKKNLRFDTTVYRQLQKYEWPGNVRELQKWVNRICRGFSDLQLSWADIPEIYYPDGDDTTFEEGFPSLPININEYIDSLRFHALEQADEKPAQADVLLGLKKGTIKQWLYQRNKRNKL